MIKKRSVKQFYENQNGTGVSTLSYSSDPKDFSDPDDAFVALSQFCLSVSVVENKISC